jgi:hypothetical protein
MEIEVIEDHVEECQVHTYEWQDYCGVKVCRVCGNHKGLAKCYCGWNLEPGERLEDDVEPEEEIPYY